METTTSADRRGAHRRVGAAAIIAFLALLLLGATHGPAQADPAVPVITPAPTVEPSQPAYPLPGGEDPGFRGRDHDGFDGRGGGGFDGGGGIPDGGGSAPAPAPSTGDSGTQT